MTHRTFIISDTHFGHGNIYRFTGLDGERVRPWAETAQVADEMMIEAWNATVRPDDKVYHLGDVAIPRAGLKCLGRLNGRKILIRGNHDIFKLADYAPHFRDVRGTHKVGRIVLSHYPIHPDNLPHWSMGNVHGHIHERRVMRRTWSGRRAPDPRYFNACVEAIGLAPISIEEVEAHLTARQTATSRLMPAWWNR